MVDTTKYTMNTQVYMDLRNDILAGRYESGQRLRQKELAEKYNVSRIPVREALVQLSSEELVEIVPYKGAIVASFSLEELHEIFEIRYALESLIIRYVVQNITEESAEQVRRLLLKSIEMPPEARSRKTNWEFHKALYEIANKPRLLQLIETQYDKVDRYIQIDLSLPNVQEKAFESHNAILQACRKGDSVEATVLLHEHMMTAVRRLDKILQKKLSDPAPFESFTLFPTLLKR